MELRQRFGSWPDGRSRFERDLVNLYQTLFGMQISTGKETVSVEDACVLVIFNVLYKRAVNISEPSPSKLTKNEKIHTLIS